MTHLRRAALLVAAMALAGGATGCAVTQAATAGPADRPAGATAPGTVATKEPGIVTAKEHGATPSAESAHSTGKHASLLSGVSCAGTQCVAVGSWYNSPPISHSLAELWDGKSWHLLTSPDGPSDSRLTGVGCDETSPVTPGTKQGIACLAAGNPVLYDSNGHWRVVRKTSPLTAVSCGGSECVAVGEKPNSTIPAYAAWFPTTGLRQGQLAAPPHAAQAVTMAGITCAASNYCIAVGDYSYGVAARPSQAARDRALAELWYGRGWRLMPTVDVSHWDQLTAVSCATPVDCTAVGTSENRLGFAEHWNGRTWTAESIPSISNPAKPGNFSLSGVSCPVAKFCVAVGDLNESDPFVETWNGSTWRLTMLPLTAADNGPVTGVSCGSVSSCVAVGFSGQTYAAIYAHGHWRLSSPVNPG